jgi:hypothetical protein
MADAVKMLKLLFAMMLVVPILWMSSCAAIGVGTVVAVDELADSKLVKKASKATKRAVQDHRRDVYYREADYSIQYDDYGEPM